MKLSIVFLAVAGTATVFGQGAKPAPKGPATTTTTTTTTTATATAPATDDSATENRAYNYDPAGRRDPFRSLLVRERERSSRPPGMQGLSVDEIELEGIWKTRTGFLAQVKAADNRSYLLKRGDLLFDGEVLDVKTNELSLRQNVNDPQSVKPFRDVVKRLNSAKAE